MMTTARHRQVIAGHVDQHRRDAAVIASLERAATNHQAELDRLTGIIVAKQATIEAQVTEITRLDDRLREADRALCDLTADPAACRPGMCQSLAECARTRSKAQTWEFVWSERADLPDDPREPSRG